jgi:crossover junction endodeoxyribonuclease RusA
MIEIDIGWPHEGLWPNGRPNRFEFSRHKRNAKNLAFFLTREQCRGAKIPTLAELGDPVPITVVCVYSNEAHRPDRDNIVAVCKAFFDGIAYVLVIDDRHFREPVIEFVKDKTRDRRLIVRLGQAT